MTARSSSPNRTNTLTKGSIRTQVNLVYGNCNRMSLLAGNEQHTNLNFVRIGAKMAELQRVLWRLLCDFVLH